MKRIISFANQKGGVGKTTLMFHASHWFARKGLKVLAVDIDPQGNLTGSFCANTNLPPQSMSRILFSSEVPKPYACSGIELLGADRRLEEVANISQLDGVKLVRKQLLSIADHYDLIFIDTPPSLSVYLMIVLALSDSIVLPVTPDSYSLQGNVMMMQKIELARELLNPDLQISGIVLNQVDTRIRSTKAFRNVIREEYALKVFETEINRLTAMKDSAAIGQSLFEYAPRSKATRQIEDFCKELAQRIEITIPEGENGEKE